MKPFQATMTAVASDGAQKWERTDLNQTSPNSITWLRPFQSIRGAKVGSVGVIELVKTPSAAFFKMTRLL